MHNIRILFVEDNLVDRSHFSRYIESERLPYICTIATSVAEARDELCSSVFDIVITDHRLGDGTARDIIAIREQQAPELPVIVVTGAGNEEIAVSFMRHGAYDYVIKDVAGAYLDQLPGIIQKALKERAAARARFILDAISEAFISIDARGAIQEWNAWAENLFGWSQEDALGREYDFLFVPSDNQQDVRALFQNLLSDASASTPDRIIEALARHKDGRKFPVEFTVTLLQTREGHSLHIFLRDISERKKLERLKDEFISTASHELRTPLAIVAMGIDNLQDNIGDLLDDKQAHVLRVLKKNVDRLGRIVDNLLDFSRLESGGAVPKYAPMNMMAVIDEVTAQIKHLARDKVIDLNVTYAKPLPLAFADEDWIVQVMHNLLGNALRYAERRIEVKVEAVDDQEQGFIQVTVSNDGLFISADDQEKLFQKFVQINRPAGGSGYKGTGLGLALCREIVKKHRGRIWVESQDGGMTHFAFRIPTVS